MRWCRVGDIIGGEKITGTISLEWAINGRHMIMPSTMLIDILLLITSLLCGFAGGYLTRELVSRRRRNRWLDRRRWVIEEAPADIDTVHKNASHTGIGEDLPDSSLAEPAKSGGRFNPNREGPSKSPAVHSTKLFVRHGRGAAARHRLTTSAESEVNASGTHRTSDHVSSTNQSSASRR